MNFSTPLFLFIFLPVILLLYYIIPLVGRGFAPAAKFLPLKNILLLCASLIFYAWGEPVVVFVMLASIAVNYIFGRLIGKRAKARLWLVLALIFNIGTLGWFKYAGFLAFNAGRLFGAEISLNIALPIGISFFTFQIMSYIIDVYTQKTEPQKNILTLALYIALFPALIAGPIIRYTDICKQFVSRTHSTEKFAAGLQRFIVGLAKKILIANNVAVFADFAFYQTQPPLAVAWLGALCFAMQIYFDFSGYSDMAIGLGKMFGFDIPENFNYPYIATTVQNFWKRWHISLSTWFRDYLYIPLGGNRKGATRTYLNLIAVFIITGFWHGASWTFVVWGLFHGAFLILERGVFGKILAKLPKAIMWLYTTLAVTIGWVIFRAEDLSQAAQYIRSMFNFSNIGLTPALANLNLFTLAALVLGITFSIPILPFTKNKLNGTKTLKHAANWASIIGCLSLFVLSVIFMTGAGFNPFLYFRF